MGNQIINANINVIGKVKEQGTPILDNIAPEYDATATYHVGDICMHEGKLYSCNTAISATTWDSSKWTETTFAVLRNDVNAKIKHLQDHTASTFIFDDSLGLNLGQPARNVTRSMVIDEVTAQKLHAAEILILNYDVEDDDIYVLQGRYSVNADEYAWTGTIRHGNEIDILDAWLDYDDNDDIVFYLRERQIALKNDVCLYQHSINVTVESGYVTKFEFVDTHSSAYTSYSDIWNKTPVTFMISLKTLGNETGKYVYLASNGMYTYDALGQAPLSQTAAANVQFVDTVTQIL